MAGGLSLLGKWSVKYQMWCSKHHPASRVKTGDLAEYEKIRRQPWEDGMWSSHATAVQTGHVKMQAAVGTNMYLELELNTDANMYLELEQSTQVQAVMTSGKQHRSFQCG